MKKSLKDDFLAAEREWLKWKAVPQAPLLTWQSALWNM
jgi:hypothetical protein